MQESRAQEARGVPDPETLFQEIRDVAFQIYEARIANDIPGDEVSDWMDAEAQVRAKYGM
jgi:hypothetical protein